MADNKSKLHSRSIEMAITVVIYLIWLAIVALAIPSHHLTTPMALRHKMLRHNHARAAAVTPRAVNATYVANVTDPSLTRDSCGSVRVGNRVLWTCRDTQLFNKSDMKIQTLPITPNSASWSDLNAGGGPKIAPGETGAASSGTNPILTMYGGNAPNYPSYFPVLDSQCPQSGACADGSRYVVWPDQPPLITRQRSDGSAIGYTWIPNQRLQNVGVWKSLDPEPSYTLYKTLYNPSYNMNTLPTVSIISPTFYPQGAIGFGRYGSLIRNDTAYLYGQTSTSQTVLARVPLTTLENRSTYQYYLPSSSTWTTTPPTFSSSSSSQQNKPYILPNAGAGGQGTFYYSSYLNSYVWIGQSTGLVGASATFFMTTAPSPAGPWVEPYLLWEGENGDNDAAPAYSLQAHPGLLPSGAEVASERGIYVSWTQQWMERTCASVYVTPLVWVEFA